MFCFLQLIVEAKVLHSDLEHNSLSSVVPVFIIVSDVDDNSPRFVQRSYRWEVIFGCRFDNKSCNVL